MKVAGSLPAQFGPPLQLRSGVGAVCARMAVKGSTTASVGFIWTSLAVLARIIHEKCAIKAKSLTSFATMRTGCLIEFFAMKSLAQAFGGLGRFRAI